MAFHTSLIVPYDPPEAASSSGTPGQAVNQANWSAKLEVADKVRTAVNDLGNVARSLVRGSGSQEELGRVASSFAALESSIGNNEQAVRALIAGTNNLSAAADAQLASLQRLEVLLDRTDVKHWAP